MVTKSGDGYGHWTSQEQTFGINTVTEEEQDYRLLEQDKAVVTIANFSIANNYTLEETKQIYSILGLEDALERRAG